MEADSTVQFNKENGLLNIHDKLGTVRLAYTAPLVRLASNKSATLALDWDAPSSSLSVSLPDLSFPVVLAFGLSMPDAKGGFNLPFPSFKFGSKVVDDSSSDDESAKGKKFGFGFDASLPEIGGQHYKSALESPSVKLKVWTSGRRRGLGIGKRPKKVKYFRV